MIPGVPRPAAGLDAFAAIAEPRRRELLAALARCDGQRDVSWLVEHLGWPQPLVSKHLGVLRKAGLVRVARAGRRRLYRIDGQQLRPVHDWVRGYERFWNHQLLRVKERAERLARRTPGNHP